MAKKKSKKKKKKRNSSRKRVITGLLITAFLLIAGSLLYLNYNFNQLIAAKIRTLYNQSEAAIYYNLRFDKLRVSLINQNIRIYNVHFEPKTKEHKDFFEKNGSLEMNVGKILIKDASIMEFLSSNNISIEKFVVKDSKVLIHKTQTKFQPFAFVKKKQQKDSLKVNIAIQNIYIQEAELYYYAVNKLKTNNKFEDFNMEISNLKLSKNKLFQFSISTLMSSISNISYHSKKGAYVSMKQFQIGLSSFSSKNEDGFFSFDFKDLYFQVIKPKFITNDSLYQFSAEKLRIDKTKKALVIDRLKVKSNLTKKQFVQHYKYQALRPEILINNIRMTNIDFDQIIDNKGLYTDSLIIQGVDANLFKSKLKPLNKHKIPHYLALQIKSIKYPLRVKVAKASDIDINFSLQQEDGHLSHVLINDLNGTLKNIQNSKSTQKLYLNAKGKIENSIPFSASLIFDYSRDRYSYNGHVYKSNLKNISKMIRSFAPVAIKSGLIKSLKFSGVINRTDSRGKMTFLYKKLNIQLTNKDKNNENRVGKFLISFAANTYLLSNNPTSPNLPPRDVNFATVRNMNKGFIHILIQSVLSGIKETVAPSRENRQRYKEKKQSQNR